MKTELIEPGKFVALRMCGATVQTIRDGTRAIPGYVLGVGKFRTQRQAWCGITTIIPVEAGHRPLNVDHARDVVAQCTWAVPVFFKQHGGRTPTAGGDVLDGERIKEFPAYLKRSSRTRVVEVSSEH